MKNTKIMLAVIATFLLTWMFMSTIGWIFSDSYTFKQVANDANCWYIMLVIGWIPSVVVYIDLDDKIK